MRDRLPDLFAAAPLFSDEDERDVLRVSMPVMITVPGEYSKDRPVGRHALADLCSNDSALAIGHRGEPFLLKFVLGTVAAVGAQLALVVAYRRRLPSSAAI
ncbi:hypothetical protein [Actinomadura oligospora]|uniref:hypothetical protein n=1 Tax=Actinomadura oligospora TaxID=111804 RepID=UPI00047E3709|nr:hypothetical protein [Actinomadura oligospora]